MVILRCITRISKYIVRKIVGSTMVLGSIRINNSEVKKMLTQTVMKMIALHFNVKALL